MTQALELEIRAIKKSGGMNSFELRDGEFKGSSAGNFLYAFPVTEKVYLRDDSPIQIEINQVKTDGVVVSLSEGVLVIALESNLGPHIAFARLISDDTFLMERIKEKLSEIQSHTVSFSLKKAFQTIGEQTSIAYDSEIDNDLIIGIGNPLNEQQIKAIKKALGSEITYLWGPPGTGKTTVIARIVEGYYKKGLTVLLVSNTNIAVDTALEKICDRLKTDSGFQSGAVLRHGPLLKPELKEKYRSQLDIEAVVARLSQKLYEKKTELETKREKIRMKFESCRQAVLELEKLEELNQIFTNHKDYLQNLLQKEQLDQSSITSLRSKLPPSKLGGFLSRTSSANRLPQSEAVAL